MQHIIVFMPAKKKSRQKKRAGARTSATRRQRQTPEQTKSEQIHNESASPNPDAERILQVVSALLLDLPSGREPSTALLLYALLQTPSTVAHRLLGTLPPDLRAQLAHEAWQSAHLHNGVSIEHLHDTAQRIAEDVCQEAIVDSRHLLMTCLIGGGFLGRPRELPLGSTETQDILGTSNSAVRAMSFAGINPSDFLERVRSNPMDSILASEGFPSFFVFLPQADRVRVLRVEEMGEFYCEGTNSRYPTTLGLLDRSIAKPLTALVELERLVNDTRTPEAQFQRFFEVHPEFLLSDEHVAARPGVLLTGTQDFGLKPDFFLARRDSPLWDIAELKLPSERLIQGRPARRGLAAAVHWGIDQLRRYREYFFDTNAAQLFHRAHGMEVYYPRLTLVIGRDESFGNYYERQRLTPPEARILTYDDVLRMARHRSLILPFVHK